jgi:hypothetical protein
MPTSSSRTLLAVNTHARKQIETPVFATNRREGGAAKASSARVDGLSRPELAPAVLLRVCLSLGRFHPSGKRAKKRKPGQVFTSDGAGNPRGDGSALKVNFPVSPPISRCLGQGRLDAGVELLGSAKAIRCSCDSLALAYPWCIRARSRETARPGGLAAIRGSIKYDNWHRTSSTHSLADRRRLDIGHAPAA